MTGRGALAGARLWAAAVALASVGIVIVLGRGGLLDPESVALSLLAPFYAALALLIATRQPGNRLAWLLFVVATWVVFSGASAAQMGNRTSAPDHATIWDGLALVWDNSGYFVGMIVPLFLFLYIFPTGVFLSRRWARIGTYAAAATSLVVFVEAFRPRIGPSDADWTIENPVGFLASGVEALRVIAGVGLIILMVGGVASAVVRHSGADAEIRAQVKWVVYALLLMAGVFIVSIFVRPFLPRWVDTVLFICVLMAVPASVTLAITRYHLYDIDRIISRTFGYAIVAGIVGLVYAVGAVWLPTVILGHQPSFFVAAATLVGAALFNPVRRWVLDRVDSRFNRARYDRVRVLNEFTANLRDISDLDDLNRDTLAVVGKTMQPVAASIWFRRCIEDSDSSR